MTYGKREEFVDFVYNMFPDDDETPEKIVSKFDEVTELPYKVGETIYCVSVSEVNPKCVKIYKDIINSVTVKFSRENITYGIRADFIWFKVLDNGLPNKHIFRKFNVAKAYAKKLAEKLNLEVIAFS